MEQQISPGKSGQGRNGGSNACIACRKVNMKCRLGTSDARCARCERKSLDCIFQQHRRGRKLGMRTSIAAATRQAEHSLDCDDPPRSTRSTARSINGDVSPSELEDLWPHGRRGLHPPNLLSRQAQVGGFSLQNVLRPGHQSNSRTTAVGPCQDSRDPVVAGLLNQAIAVSLFAGFMADLNPFVSQLDLDLHSLDYVRANSSFLFTAILMAASKVFNPALYNDLRDHAELLLLDAVRYGWKSTEVVQAILILTYWKDPDDTRVFVNVGLAIRIAVDLGWHELASLARRRAATNTIDDRERRNAERTWLVLFVYDRSLAMQTGKPVMIEHDALIDSVEYWQKSPISCPSDVLLGALVELRLLTSALPGTFHRHGKGRHNTPAMIKLMYTSVEQWSSRWLRVVAAADKRHQFLTNFYGRHTLLMLCSEDLYRALNSNSSAQDLHLESIWRGYNTALDVLRLVVEPANADLVYFVQDSVHVMIAYAAVLLVKLLHSVRKAVRDELEPACLSTLKSLLAVIKAQAAPTNSACSLQAVFIANLLNMLQAAPQDHTEATRSVDANTAPDPEVGVALSTDRRRQITGCNANGDERPSPPQSNPSAGLATYDPLDSGLFDDEMWATVFATAGFSITEGTFLPELAAQPRGQ